MVNFSKVFVLLRGVAGSSKSTFAKYLAFLGDALNPIVITADDYFTNTEGIYKFNPQMLGVAHNLCRIKFEDAVTRQVPLIVLANTSTKISDFQPYIDKAQKNDYTIFSIVMERRFEGGDNGHAVPEEALQRQENGIKSSLKLR